MKLETWYSHSWTEFEVQSLAYSILHKTLYPKFIVRGEYFFPKTEIQRGCKLDIAIFLPGKYKDPPKLILIIEVKKGQKSKSEKQGKRYSDRLNGIPYLYIRGKEDAYNVLNLIQPYICKY